MKIMQDMLMEKMAAAARICARVGACGPLMTSISALSRGRNWVNRCR